MGTKEICILVIDTDPACFKIVAEMLPCCTHKVLHFDQIADALNTIWKSKDRLEFVLTNVQRSDTNRFEIIQHIEKEFKLPIISISSDENKKTVPLGLESGITLYFLKSLSMNNVNNLRHFAYAREKGKLVEPEIAASAQMASATENAIDQVGTRNESSVGEAFGGYEKHKRRELKRTAKKSEDSPNDYPCEKKQRVVWTAKMHDKFLEAIQQLGHERAFPKKIVEVMDVPGLTRENVASHLQKYRMCLKRGQEAKQSAGSNYGINFSTDVEGTCFPSSYPLRNLYSSQGISPYPMQQTNLTPLQQLSNFTISMPPTNNFSFTNPEASTPMSNLGYQQSVTLSNQGNLHYPCTHNVSSVQAMPQNNTNYLEFASIQPNCQRGSTPVESIYLPNIPLNNKFRLYEDHTKNILFNIENSMSSNGTKHPGTSSNTSSAYVGYRFTNNGKSVKFGQMGGLGNDEMIGIENVLSTERSFVNESSVHRPSTSLNSISLEQHALPPLLQLQHELMDSFEDEGDLDDLLNATENTSPRDLDVLLNATENTSPQWFWDSDFADALFNHSG